MIVQIAEHRFYPTKIHVVRSSLHFLGCNGEYVDIYLFYSLENGLMKR